MANKKISDLPASASVATTATVPVVQAGVTEKATVAQIQTAVVAGTPAWTLQSGRWYRLPNGSLSTNGGLGNGTLRANPKFIPTACTLDRIGAEITIVGDVGSKLRLGIYNDDGTGRPGTLLLDAGQILGDSATVQTLTISQALSRGWYWFAAAVQAAATTQPTVRTLSNAFEICPTDYLGTPTAGVVVTGFTQSSVSGALPTPFGTPASGSSAIPAIFGRVA